MITPTAARAIASIPVLILFGAPYLCADDIPRKVQPDRYNAMLEKSPFAVATAPNVPAATPNFAKDLYVANAARVPGEDVVTLQSSADKALKEYLTTKGPNEHGYSVSNIEWSDHPGATKVTVSKDGQFATLGFNQALMTQGPSGAAMPLPAGAPGLATPIPAYVPPRPATVPTYPTPPPHVRGIIQRNPNVQPQPVPARPSVGDQTQEQ
jgi:hypothetical protein